LAPEVTVSHGALVEVVHAQLPGVVTFTVPLPPAASIDCDGGEIATRQDRPAWFTGAATPFNVMRPCRAEVAGFAATWNRTSPAPWPEAGLKPVIQLTSDAAVHAHSAGVATVTEPAPPPASMDVWGAVNETSHLAGDGAVETVADDPHAAATAADVTSISSVFNAPPG
jgi:hypothetical protein